MAQNIIDITFSAEAIAAIEAALTELETQLSGFIALTPDQRRQLTKMGDKSEAFCRQAVSVLGENPGVLAKNFDLDGFRRDLAALDVSRPWLVRLSRLYERANDTDMALGSDLMTSALEGYAFLKIAGKGAGLDNMRKMLSARFSRSASRDNSSSAPPDAQPA